MRLAVASWIRRSGDSSGAASAAWGSERAGGDCSASPSRLEPAAALAIASKWGVLGSSRTAVESSGVPGPPTLCELLALLAVAASSSVEPSRICVESSVPGRMLGPSGVDSRDSATGYSACRGPSWLNASARPVSCNVASGWPCLWDKPPPSALTAGEKRTALDRSHRNLFARGEASTSASSAGIGWVVGILAEGAPGARGHEAWGRARPRREARRSSGLRAIRILNWLLRRAVMRHRLKGIRSPEFRGDDPKRATLEGAHSCSPRYPPRQTVHRTPRPARLCRTV